MILLEIYTDCQTSSEVAKECPESHEGLQGKGRRKNKHSVCVYTYMASLRGEVAKDKTKKKFEPFPSPSPPTHSPPTYIEGLAFFLVVLLYDMDGT